MTNYDLKYVGIGIGSGQPETIGDLFASEGQRAGNKGHVHRQIIISKGKRGSLMLV